MALELTDTNFQQEVINSDKLSVVRPLPGNWPRN